MDFARLIKSSCMAGMLFSLFFVAVGHAASVAVKPETALRQAFPQVSFESVEPTEVKGLYMVVSGTNILYFYPEGDLLFVGDIYRKGGQSITAAKRQEIASRLAHSLPLDKAVKIGSGPKVVIEFTDPDCPYCRKASEFFKNRTDVTRYVFFAPLAHPQAITKIHYILNARDKAHAYQEMMENKAPSQPKGGYGEAIKSLAQEHLSLARKVGVQGTPTFFIGGTQVVGADVAQLERLLKNDKPIAK